MGVERGEASKLLQIAQKEQPEEGFDEEHQREGLILRFL